MSYDSFKNKLQFTIYLMFFFLVNIPLIQLPIMCVSPYVWRCSEFFDCLFYVSTASIILSVLVLITYVKDKKLTIKKIFAHPTILCFFSFIALTTVSMIYNGSYEKSLIGVSFRFQGIFTFIAGVSLIINAAQIKSKKTKTALFHNFILVAIILSIYMLLTTYCIIPMNGLIENIRAATFFHFNHFGYFLTMAVMCAIGLSIFSKSKKYKIIFGIISLFLFFTLILNGTFGCFVAVLFGVVIVGISLCVKNKKFSIKNFIWLVILILFSNLFAAFPSSMPGERMISYIKEPIESVELALGKIGHTTKIIYDKTSVIYKDVNSVDDLGSGRIALWKGTLDFIEEKPLLGYGIDSMNKLYVDKGLSATQAHNEYLQYAACVGIPATLLYILGFILLYVKKVKKASKCNVESMMAIYAVSGYLISAFFGVALMYTCLYLFMFTGFAMNNDEEGDDNEIKYINEQSVSVNNNSDI